MLLYQILAFNIHGKKNHAKIKNLKYQLQREMKSLNYLMDPILYQTILIISSKNMEELLVSVT